MDFLYEIFLFLLKTLIIVVGLLAIILIPLALSYKRKTDKKKKLELEDLKDQFKDHIQEFQHTHLDKKSYKNYLKKLKKEEPANKEKKPSSFVLSFTGDKMATQVESLRDEVSLILNIAKPEDEVILLLESPGGAVAPYGLAASQLLRIRNSQLKLTICVDTVAASGGYLMACVGHQILSAPFAMIGSIGVLFQMPNIYEFLKKKDIAYEEVTAGKYKRTLTPFGKVTEEKKQKLQEQINLIYSQFKDFIKEYREGLDFDKVATGEAWLGEEALKLKLVDKIQCSDDYIIEALKTRHVYKIKLKAEKKLLEKITKKLSFLQNSKDQTTNAWENFYF